uniref:HopJ type III effector protein n=1 Tax=Pyramimonas obovata TaxID=1411642 RepID=A0A7S0MVS7_9CHLO|eukprot:CAMPEP_0118925760 /NCGR_PEP_ID=MMETSP1169-20130426/3593_1 /TAXON_ID=36882 /ORGANISM="Pyramimonas obovata, Strain CCMP722" /LENGTH=234 /DNA_ID=CAMNT_0006867143 /DNA_START=36 /DNA_END=740 /DNA_ORIENTATION=-
MATLSHAFAKISTTCVHHGRDVGRPSAARRCMSLRPAPRGVSFTTSLPSTHRMHICRAMEGESEGTREKASFKKKAFQTKSPNELEMFRMTAAAAIASPTVLAKVEALVELAQQEWGLHGVRFEEVMELMNECYIFEPTEYISGKGQPYEVVNPAGTNSGSCKVFAFGKLHNLSEEQTMKMFCEHYQGVLEDPDGDAHANIRSFMKNGWEGITFAAAPLTLRSTLNAAGDTDGI